MSFRTLQNLLENRLPLLSTFVSLRPSIFLGVEGLRGAHGSALERLTHALAFRFASATTKTRAFGVLHSSVSSLASSSLALSTSRTLRPNLSALITVQHSGIGTRRTSRVLSPSTFVLHIGTHTPDSTGLPNGCDVHRLPLVSSYERTGHFLTLDGPFGRLRRHRKAVTAPSESRSLDLLWTSLLRATPSSLPSSLAWHEGLVRLSDHVPSTLLERTLPHFVVNPFSFFTGVGRRSSSFNFDPVYYSATILPSTTQDLYISDILSRNSATMGECSLFFGEPTAFPRERLYLYFFYFL